MSTPSRAPTGTAASPATPADDLLSEPSLPKGIDPALRYVLLLELSFLRHVQRMRRRLPLGVRWVCDRLISSHPARDLSVAVWMALPAIVYVHGWPAFWMASLNLFLAFILSWVLGGPVPGDLDARLRPRGRVSSKGFPCVELQVLAAMGWYAILTFASPAITIGVVLSIGILAALRIYGCTHFPHQLLVSIALGIGTVPAALAWSRWAFKEKVPWTFHSLAAFAVVAIAVGYIALLAESNDVPVMRVPRAEYMRVLGGLINDAEEAAAVERAGRGGGDKRRGGGGSSNNSVASSNGGVGVWSGGGSDSSRSSVYRGMGGGMYPPAGPGGLGAGMQRALSEARGGAGVYPPAGPGGGSIGMRGVSSYPPMGPARGSRAGSVVSDTGSGLEPLGVTDDRERRRPRDSLYYLLRRAGQG